MITKEIILKEKDYLHDLLKDNDYGGIAEFFNSPVLVDNPNPPNKIPVGVDLGSLFGLLSPPDVEVLLKCSEILRCGVTISSILSISFTRTPAQILEMLRKFGLSEDGWEKVKTSLAQLREDPNYRPKVFSHYVREDYDIQIPVTAEDVQLALN